MTLALGDRLVMCLATVLLFLLSVVVTMNFTSAQRACPMLLAFGAGTGLVYILRWYWWPINASSRAADGCPRGGRSLDFLREVNDG